MPTDDELNAMSPAQLETTSDGSDPHDDDVNTGIVDIDDDLDDDEDTAAAAAAVPVAATPAAVVEPVAAPAPAPAPERQNFAPDDIDAQRDSLRAERSAAHAKLLDGESTQEEFNAIEARVDSKLDDLLTAQVSDRVRANMEQGTLIERWNGLHTEALTAAKAVGIDYAAEPAKLTELNDLVSFYGQQAAKQGMSDEGSKLTASRWALNEAATMMNARYGTAKAPAAAPSPPVKPPRAAADLSQLPPTLAGIPAAADPTVTGSDEFAHIDRLSPSAAERAIAKLTPAEQDRYLAA